MLCAALYEILAILEMEQEYTFFAKALVNVDFSHFIPYTSQANIQRITPEEKRNLEEILFENEIYNEGFQSSIELDNEFNEFLRKTRQKNEYEFSSKSESIGYDYLIYLAHIFYNTPFFPKFWRELFDIEINADSSPESKINSVQFFKME